MSISSITSSAVDLAGLYTNSSTTALQPSAATTPSGAPQLSGMAQAIGKLQSLEQSNPAQAKQVLSDIAGKLKTEAQAVGGAKGEQLSSLADKFQQASSSGDLSSLQQAAGHAHRHHGGGGHHKATAAYAQQQQSGQDESIVDVINDALGSTTN